MSVTDDVKYQFSLVTRKPGETTEALARRLFYLQMEVYSANAGVTLYHPDDFEHLDDKTKMDWIEKAGRMGPKKEKDAIKD